MQLLRNSYFTFILIILVLIPINAEEDHIKRKTCLAGDEIADGGGRECDDITSRRDLIAMSNLELQDQIEQILSYFIELLQGTSPIYLNDVTQSIIKISDILNIEENLELPIDMMVALEMLGTRIDLDGVLNATIVGDNVALLMANPSVDNPVVGIRILNLNYDRFYKDAFKILAAEDPGYLAANASDVVVYLPAPLTTPDSRVSFVVFRKDYGFGELDLPTILSLVNSRVISVKVDNTSELDGEMISLYFKPFSEPGSLHMCANWGYSNWSNRGCLPSMQKPQPGMLYRCVCQESTYVAQLILSGDSDITSTMSTAMTTASTLTPMSSTSATTAPPTIEDIINDLENLLNNDSDPSITDVDQIFDQINDLLSIDEDVVFPTEFLRLLDELGFRIDLNGTETAALVKDNIALMMADVEDSNPVRGLSVAYREEDVFTDDAFKFLSNMKNINLNSTMNELVVHLPESVLNSPRRISFVVFHNDRAFNNREESIVNSRVISINVYNMTQFDNGEVVNIHMKPLRIPERDRKRSCGYWALLDDSTGYWSQEGCTFIRSRNPVILDTCQCDHLTHFAEILIVKPVFSEQNEAILEMISIIGCSLSILGAIIILITFVLFKTWRLKFRNQIWLQLSLALLIMSICFLVVVFVKYDEYSVSCLLTGIILHFSVLTSFCWMLVTAIKAYRDLVIVFTKYIPCQMTLATIFSWGLPIIVIVTYIFKATEPYKGRFEEMTPSGSFCYPSGLDLWFSVYIPIAVILLINVILFFYTIGFVSSSIHNQNITYYEEAHKCARIGIVLVFLFGLPWIFGLFAFNIVAAYMFTVTATFQCFILFIFIICGNKETRDLWLFKLKLKPMPRYKRQSASRRTILPT
ncbi:adhesion G-protein coupled receptor G6-like [Galleria mellonella]|uniref:Adhesion G-protein coupled receptor G6-like n=1 Tax=Galleria mellonella TaxID=7137 RepID=A0ABM3MQR6_GALME|nr:adhesion G-protein coupled receptor G6-like [Galleria mellonella]